MSSKDSTVGRSTPTLQSSNPSTSNRKGDGDIELPDADIKTTELTETLRVKLPDTFSGNRKDLEIFILQVELYMHFNDDKFPDPRSYPLWTTSYLRGEALRWVEPFLADYFENKNEGSRGMMVTTKSLLGTWAGFKKEIRRMSSDIDAAKTATSILIGMKQTGSVIAYSTEFQPHANKSQWDSKALMSLYEKGLKDHIRIELARKDTQPEDIISLIEQTIRIDNAMYEFNRDKANFSEKRYNHKKSGFQRQHYRPQNNNWSDPMEIDATSQRKNPLSKAEMQKRRDNKLCFECGLPGHRADTHRGKKPWKGKQKQVNATGRGGYNKALAPKREICATSRYQIMSELELENEQINTRVRGYEAVDEEDCSAKGDRQGASDSDEAWGIVGGPATPSSPQIKQIWEVSHRDITTGIRLWYHKGTNRSYAEPGIISIGGPSWREKYRVVFQNPQRIAWQSLNDLHQSFIQQIPVQPVYGLWTEPKVGTVWETNFVAETYISWVHADNMNEIHQEDTLRKKQYDDEHQLRKPITGRLYTLEWEQNSIRGWTDILNGSRYYETFTGPYEIEVPGMVSCRANTVLNATDGIGQLFCNLRINNKNIRAMIDSGATGNFISPAAVMKLGIPTELKEELYELVVVDGTPINQNDGLICIETSARSMTILGNHQEDIQFDVVPIGHHQVILGMP